MEWMSAIITFQILLVVLTYSAKIPTTLKFPYAFNSREAFVKTDEYVTLENFSDAKDHNESDKTQTPSQFVLPFDWSYLRKINGTSKKLGNCCSKEIQMGKILCLKSPLPVCPTRNSTKCSIFSINYRERTPKKPSPEELMHGCCCELNAGGADKTDISKSMKGIVSRVHGTHGKSGKMCVCLIIEDNPCETNNNILISKDARRKCLESLVKTYVRRKRGTISNPMIYPSFRHINERKRIASNPGSNFEVKMETGSMPSMGMGSSNWSMSSGFNYDDFGRRRYKRELHVLVTRYSKNERRKRSPSWSQSHSRRRMNDRRRSKQRYFREDDGDDITATPFTFLNVSFTGYTEERTTTSTTTEKPKTLKMTQNDREFVHGKKKEEPKPKFEAVLENGPSQLRIRVEK